MFGPRDYIKYNGPFTAYYINNQQRLYFESEIFTEKVMEFDYRPCMKFTANDKLQDNGKINLLVICCEKFLNLEKKYIPLLVESDIYNVYVKPHPETKNFEEYLNLQRGYNFVLLESRDYPHVDLVLSYESTLAYEYEDVGVNVLKYNDINFDDKFQLMLTSKK